MKDYLNLAVTESITNAKALIKAGIEEAQAQHELEHDQCSHSYWERKYEAKEAALTLMKETAVAVSNAISRAAEEELTAEG